MSIANVTLLNTFMEWLTNHNALTVEINRMLEGIYVTSGNVTITNALGSPVSLNVTSGMTRTPVLQVGTGSLGNPSIHQYGTGNNNTGILFSATSNTIILVNRGNATATFASSGNVGINATPSNAKFEVSGPSLFTGKMIVQSGNVGIGISSPSYALHISGDAFATGQFYGASDERLKKNVKTIEGALGKVLSLRGVNFSRSVDPDNFVQMGLIAQETVNVIPEVVTTDKWDYMGISYAPIVALLIEAIKELYHGPVNSDKMFINAENIIKEENK